MFIKESLNKKYYFVSLAGAILVYFAVTRIAQDWLYRGFRRPVNLFESLGPLFSRPEPWEMPLYLLGIAVIPFLAAILLPVAERLIEAIRQIGKNGQWKYLLPIVAIMVIFAGSAFIRAFNFGFYLNYIQDKGLGKVIWLLLTKRLYVAYLIFSVSVVAFVWAYFRKTLFRIPSCLSPLPPLYKGGNEVGIKGEREQGIGRGWEWIFLILLAFLIFHPNLPAQDHHYNYYIGSLNDHLNGKPLLYETTHLYGLLDVYFLAFVFKFILPFSYTSLSLILFFFYFGFFTGLYFFLKKWLKTPLWGMIGVMVLVAVMYFFNSSPTRSVYLGPATTPFRFWLYIPILLLILSSQANPKTIKRELALFLSAAAMFWNFDSGSFIAGATVLAFWSAQRFRFKELPRLGLRLLGYVAGIFATLTLINFAVYDSWPNWLLFFKEWRQFRAGIGMTPLPLVGIFEIFLLVYLGTGVWILKQSWAGEKSELVLTFLALHGIFSLLYYVGESSWQNLTFVSYPALLVGLYFFRHFSELRLVRAAFLAVLLYALLFFLVKLPVEFNNRDYSRFQKLDLVSDNPDQNLYADAQEIRTNYSELEQIPLLHLADTRLLLYARKPNFFDFYYMFTLYYYEDIEREARRLAREKPKYLFVAHQKDDRIDYFMSLLPQDYQKTRTLRTLDVYEPR